MDTIVLFGLALTLPLLRDDEHKKMQAKFAPHVGSILPWLFWVPVAMGAIGLCNQAITLKDCFDLLAPWSAVQILTYAYVSGCARAMKT